MSVRNTAIQKMDSTLRRNDGIILKFLIFLVFVCFFCVSVEASPVSKITQWDAYGVVVGLGQGDVTVQLGTDLPEKALFGQKIVIENSLSENPAENVPVHVGARVLIHLDRNPQTQKWTYSLINRDRTPAILILGSLFLIGVVVMGGPTVCIHVGLVALMLTGCYQALFPAILSGQNAWQWGILMCFAYTVIASWVYRPNKVKAHQPEQAVVLLGVWGSLLVLGLILWLMHAICPLNGYTSEEVAALWYQSPHFQFWPFFWISALLGFQGFLFHLCWTLAQSRQEPDGKPLSFQERFSVVMHRGQHLLGPMMSSVGLLFLGLFLPSLLQLKHAPTAQFVNLESTASAFTLIFAGGLTLLIAVPLTALIAACLLSRKETL